MIEHSFIISICISRIVVTQPYNPEILTEYVIRGNSAILKCSIPSYIAEFVTVEAWIREDGEVYLPEDPAVGQGTTRSLADLDYFVNASGEFTCELGWLILVLHSERYPGEKDIGRESLKRSVGIQLVEMDLEKERNKICVGYLEFSKKQFIQLLHSTPSLYTLISM